MPKFFVDKEQIMLHNNTIVITNDAEHISRVLRMKAGDEITVCDGRANDYTARIKEIGKKEVVCEIIRINISETEPSVFVTLYQGLPKASKMEYVIQKATELGVGRIVPVATQRAVAKENTNKLERWRKIALGAAKQCNRGVVPEVSAPVDFEQAVFMMAKDDLAIMPYEGAKGSSLKDVLFGGIKSASVMIGPEGGFDVEEVRIAEESNLKIVSLGKRILRTETAGSAVIAIIMHETGNL